MGQQPSWPVGRSNIGGKYNAEALRKRGEEKIHPRGPWHRAGRREHAPLARPNDGLLARVFIGENDIKNGALGKPKAKSKTTPFEKPTLKRAPPAFCGENDIRSSRTTARMALLESRKGLFFQAEAGAPGRIGS